MEINFETHIARKDTEKFTVTTIKDNNMQVCDLYKQLIAEHDQDKSNKEFYPIAIYAGKLFLDKDSKQQLKYYFDRKIWVCVKNYKMNIFIKGVSGRTFMINVLSNDTIEKIAEEIEKQENVPKLQQRLLFAGSQLHFDKTLHNYKIQNESTIHLVLALRGGGSIGTNFIDFSNSSKVQWSKSAPKWRVCYPGLCMEGICDNYECDAYKELVICNLEFGEFNLGNEQDMYRVRCPICDTMVTATTCGFNNCNWSVAGFYTDSSSSNDNKVKYKELPEAKALNEYIRFDEKDNKTVKWEVLKIRVFACTIVNIYDRDECPICLEHIRTKEMAEKYSFLKMPADEKILDCNHKYHIKCIDQWAEQNSSCPMCRCVI